MVSGAIGRRWPGERGSEPSGWIDYLTILMPEDPLTPRKRGELRQAGGRSLALLALAAALVVGIQVGAIPWRYRKQLWQLQGAVVGVVVGFVAGRLSRSEDSAH